MAYKPTGNPGGRPRNDGQPVAQKDPRPCKVCWPGDLGMGVYSASCPHVPVWQNSVLTSGRCVAK